eukprot:CFRG4631T1
MSDIRAAFPGRENHINKLLCLLEYPECRPNSLFIYGQPSVGKTAVTRTVVESLNAKHVYIDCIECFTPRLMYERAVTQLYAQVYVGEKSLDGKGRNVNMDGQPLKIKAANLDEFCVRLGEISAQALRSQVHGRSSISEGIILVFDNAEKIRSWADLPGILKLSELVGNHTNDPINCGLCTEYDTIKLYKFIEPYFKKTLAKLYLKDIGAEAWARQINMTGTDTMNSEIEGKGDCVELETDINTNVTGDGKRVGDVAMSSREKNKLLLERRTERVCRFVADMDKMRHVDLPYYSRYLLTAAYLASNNPTKHDSQYFGHGNTARKVVRKRAGVKTKKTGIYKKPSRSFPVDRLLAIFFTLIDESTPDMSLITLQLETLVYLGLLSKTSAADSLDVVKYRCDLTYEFTLTVAFSINVNLGMYLHEG